MVFEDIWVLQVHLRGQPGLCAYVTDVGFHVENHRIWLKCFQENHSKFKKLQRTSYHWLAKVLTFKSTV